ncbi:MAG TPA: FAD-dependent oxidoreductase [Acidimicrobiales bacterium]|jgi:pyruvate/2-oxoglutarate dehydrogenase complex dihydrolipoamide dehydrogenase (E3) component|nr:FAD-dependent oxidoreductase [Acidimicrobiales bacterium]
MARYDLVIVGMGSGGMIGAEFAATIGLRVAVVERSRVGGDCLWTGCVPSKALLASAKAAHTMAVADRYGLPAVRPEIDTSLVWKRIREIQQDIAATDDNPDRFEAMGVEVVRGTARLTGPNSVLVSHCTGEGTGSERELESRVILLCTGSRPAVPPLDGLHQAGFLTSETLFEIDRAPRSIVMVGGGPIAIEMAQAFVRLGVRTTVLQRGPRILPRDDPALVDVLTRLLGDEGADLRTNVSTDRVTVSGSSKVVHGSENGEPARWEGEELLVAVGRRPNVEGLGLEEVGVKVGKRGVEIDERMRTSVPSVYACGDVAGRYLFTHSAGYEAVRAVRDAFFPGKGKVTDFVPWCTFTDPELAHAGLTVAEAEEKHGDDVEVYRLDLSHSDRARADGATEGAIVLVTAKGRLVGAHVLAPAGGEMIHELALAINEGMKLAEVASLIHVYPTLSTGIGQLAAEAAFEGAKRLRWLVRKEK